MTCKTPSCCGVSANFVQSVIVDDPAGAVECTFPLWKSTRHSVNRSGPLKPGGVPWTASKMTGSPSNEKLPGGATIIDFPSGLHDTPRLGDGWMYFLLVAVSAWCDRWHARNCSTQGKRRGLGFLGRAKLAYLLLWSTLGVAVELHLGRATFLLLNVGGCRNVVVSSLPILPDERRSHNMPSIWICNEGIRIPQDKPDKSHKSRGESDGPSLPSFLELDQRYLGHIISHPDTDYLSG